MLESALYGPNATIYIQLHLFHLLKPSHLRLHRQNHHLNSMPPATGMKLFPPNSSVEDMETMKNQFAKKIPGEVFDSHSTPSVRLWFLVEEQKINTHIKYIPIQLRLSEHQYSAMIETRSSKPRRSEIQLLSQLCWDDTPEIDINSVRFSRDWLNRTSTVLRNAYALCGMCHLQVFKALDSKISEHTFPHLDSELGVRHVIAQEFFSADKKIWGVISQLYSRGTWTFEECLNELTVVRSDISSLLQPRPRIPKPLPPPRDGKGKGKGKGHFKGKDVHKGGGKGKTKGSTFDKKHNWCTWGFHNNQRVALCMKFNAGECRRGSDCYTIIMAALSVSAMDTLVCRITQQRITQDPPDFRLHHQHQSTWYQMVNLAL